MRVHIQIYQIRIQVGHTRNEQSKRSESPYVCIIMWEIVIQSQNQWCLQNITLLSWKRRWKERVDGADFILGVFCLFIHLIKDPEVHATGLKHGLAHLLFGVAILQKSGQIRNNKILISFVMPRWPIIFSVFFRIPKTSANPGHLNDSDIWLPANKSRNLRNLEPMNLETLENGTDAHKDKIQTRNSKCYPKDTRINIL